MKHLRKLLDLSDNISSKWRDPLFRNSFFLIVNRIFNASCGMIFWMIAARLYSISDVGLATALISSLGLIILFSRLGLDSTVVRFFATYDRNKLFNTYLIITTSLAFIIGLIYIYLLQYVSPELILLKKPFYSIIFLLLVIFNSIANSTSNTFLAFRDSKYVLLQNIVLGTRIIFLIPFLFLGSFGLICSWMIAYSATSIISIIILKKNLELGLNIDKDFLNKYIRYSLGNYFSSVFFIFPTMVLPLMLLNLLGNKESAQYYVMFSIASIILIIPDSLSTSLFVEGSHGEPLRKIVIKAGKTSFLILLPSAFLLYLTSGIILSLFGSDYIDALELLRVFILSSFFVVIFYIFIPIQNIRMQVRSIFLLNFLRMVLLIVLNYILISRFGLIGVGYAWMATYIILSIIVIIIAKKENWI